MENLKYVRHINATPTFLKSKRGMHLLNEMVGRAYYQEKKKHTHVDLIINQEFTPSAKNQFGDVRHTGRYKKDTPYGKKGQKFETWLLKDTNSFKLL